MFDDLKKQWQNLVGKVTGKTAKPKDALVTTVASSYEINLVPEVKLQMIRAQKMRNLVLFICIVVSIASVSAVLVLFGIKSGQDIAMASQDAKLKVLSGKLTGYEELTDLVTLQGQLSALGDVADNKTVLSRVFGALNVMLPAGDDTVQLSNLRVDLDTKVLRMEGQADAKVSPLIDYRVLESFKKGVSLTKYDYGRYVDADGHEIPTWCISEADADGNAYRVGESYYAWWDLSTEGCAALAKGSVVPANSKAELFYNDKSEVETAEVELSNTDLEELGAKVEIAEDGTVTIDVSGVTADNVEARDENGVAKYYKQSVTRVKVWRTPQFTEWHNGGYMELDGSITGIEHFKSACTEYSGVAQQGGGAAKWTSTNDCMLVPDGLTVIDSSNGRDESDNLVLKFTATMTVERQFFLYRNKHMIAIGPMGQNVTDSYMQIGGMFTQEAEDCGADDSECLTNSTNTGGTNNGQ